MKNSEEKKVIKNQENKKEITPLRCITGSSISGLMAIAAYNLMIAIAQTYANKPINFNNQFAANIASAVRTLVVGITALATGLFTMVTIGLFALAIQLIFQKLKGEENVKN
jgi:hypothetical protein